MARRNLKSYSIADKKKYLEDYHASGISTLAFANKIGVSESSLHRWLELERKGRWDICIDVERHRIPKRVLINEDKIELSAELQEIQSDKMLGKSYSSTAPEIQSDKMLGNL